MFGFLNKLCLRHTLSFAVSIAVILITGVLPTGVIALPSIYYEEALNWAVAEGIVGGAPPNAVSYEWFRPYDTVNRAEMAKMIMEANDIEFETVTSRKFLDVAPQAWYFEYVHAGFSQGLFGGYTDANGIGTGYFGPRDEVTRASMAKILAKAYVFETHSCDKEFRDVDYGAWYAPFVDIMCAADIMRGDSGGMMRPAAPVTRAEFITMLFRAAGEPEVNTAPPPDELEIPQDEVIPEEDEFEEDEPEETVPEVDVVEPEPSVDEVPAVDFPDFDSQVYNNFARLRAPTGRCADGSCAVHVAQFAVGTTFDGVTLRGLTFRNDDNSENFNGRFGTFFLVHDGHVVDTASFTDAGGSEDGTVEFGGFSYTLAKGKRHKLNVLAEIHDIQNAAQSGSFIKLYVENSGAIDGISATNGNSIGANNIIITAGPTGDYIQTHIARKSYPLIEDDNDSTPTRIFSPLDSAVVYRFKMSAHPQGDIEWSKLTFAVEETAGISSSNYKLYVRNSSVALNTGVDPASGKVVIIPTNPIKIPSGQTVEFILKADIDLTNTVQSQNLSLTLTAASDTERTTATASALSASDFIWSDLSDKNHSSETQDWTNGLEVDTFDFDSVNIGYQGTGS